MANLSERVDALEKLTNETEDRVIVLETNQVQDSGRLRRIEGGVWFVVGSVLVALLGAVITLLAR